MQLDFYVKVYRNIIVTCETPSKIFCSYSYNAGLQSSSKNLFLFFLLSAHGRIPCNWISM